ncbi:carboxymuconolactone decarboxylase family protein [Arthrobacter sp. NPDC055138]
MKEPAQLSEAGLATRRQVLGDAYVNGATQHDDLITKGFQPLVTNFCWDEIWNDDTLSLRERSIIVLAVTGALGRMSEFRIHTQGAINNGVTEAELLAIIKQIAVYAGVPAGVTGSKVMREVVAEHRERSAQELDDAAAAPSEHVS